MQQKPAFAFASECGLWNALERYCNALERYCYDELEHSCRNAENTDGNTDASVTHQYFYRRYPDP